MSDPTQLDELVPIQWRPIISQARTATAERRARVLQHPDLADRLKARPLGYVRPDQWNGYVPPAELPEPFGPNRSPRRAALVEISAEAWRREHEQVAS